MVQNSKNNCHMFNKILKQVIFKKKYVKKLKNKIKTLKNISKQNYKKFNAKLYLKKDTTFLITYVIEICFSKSNTLLQITNSLGVLKFFCSAGYLLFKGKSKKARIPVLKKIIGFLLKKLKFLENRPTALHLKNVRFRKAWIIKKLEKKIFLKTVTGFNLYSYNGCRRRKNRRKR